MSDIKIDHPSENSLVIHLNTDQLACFFKKHKSSAPFDKCGFCGDTDHSTEQHGVFRTKMCSHFKNNCCKFLDDCSFAHSESQVRRPWG
jgi:hypothetical protein